MLIEMCGYLKNMDVTMEVESYPNDSPLRRENSLLPLIALFDGAFSLDWLVELTGMKASLILALLEGEVQNQVLVKKEPAVYLFKNIKKRDEWRGELSDDERELYHRSIANVLVRELPDDDSKALSVAHHLLQISNDWKGSQWLVRAGDICMRSFSAENAIACFEKALNDLSGQRGSNEDWLFVKAAIGHSNAALSRSDAPETISWLQEARKRAKRLKNSSFQILLEMHIAKYERFVYPHKALQRFEQALSRVEGLNDPELAAATTTFSAYFLFWQGRFRDVVEIYEKSVPDVEKYPIGPFSIVAALMVGQSYTMVGRITQGLGLLDTIHSYCLLKGDRYLSAHAGFVIAITMLSINRVEDTFRYLKSTLKDAREGRNHLIEVGATLLLAVAHYMQGDTTQALEHLHKFLQHRQERPLHSMFPYYIAEICWAVETGQLPPIQGLSLEQVLDRMLDTKNIFMQGIAHRYKALLGKLRGWSGQEIIRLFALSVKDFKVSGSQIELARTYLELARHYSSTGKDKKGEETMQIASKMLSSTNTEMIPDDLRALVRDQNVEGAVLTEILRLTTEMASRKEKKKLLQQIVATVNRLTGAERGALLLIDDGADPLSLQLRASKGLTLEQINHESFARARETIEKVVKSRRGLIFKTSSEEKGSSHQEGTIGSSICVPVMMDEKLIGVLYHDNRLLLNAFKESDLMLISYFAALASLDLDGAKAHQEIQRLQQKREESETIYEGNIAQTNHFEGIIGTGPAIRHILGQIAEVTKTDTTVLILGETGVGKNLVAEAIHRQSLRRDGPFITVQCSALTESLITSELFGHEKGAFTGATARYIGRFEMAHGGTLFLDEIGDLSLEVQARLLRVLQSKEFERVGGGKDILTSDFRLIAATNRNLEEDVQAKRFREDLYYRINVFPLLVPPLRERKEDIPLLVHHFLGIHNMKQGTNFDKIRQEVMETLVRHTWPGNIRELENVVQRGVISSHGHVFQLPVLDISQPKNTRSNTFTTLKENERQHILEALQASGWKIHGPGGAAEILDINSFTLSTRMTKLGIKRAPKSASKQSKTH
jgi:formate hydrogenlyase transcriptional activator